MWICYPCQKEHFEKCRSSWSCDCECNKGGAADITQKCLASLFGVGLAIGGVVSMVGFFPFGTEMLGAGINSTYQGVVKSINGERLNAKEYVDGFGTVTCVFTGAGAFSESVVANVTKQGAKIMILAGTGIDVGVGAKAISEVKECSTTEKKWDDFDKTLNSDGNVSVDGTIVSLTASGVVGAVGVGSTQMALSLTNGMSSGLQECMTRVVVSGANDAIIQR